MFDPEIKELLLEISNNVEATGRRIRSPKNDYRDLNDLSKALMDSSNALFRVVLMEIAKKNPED